ncbi:MAG TPA: SH3 domain-containing protein [Tepidiformaceae bacterium]|nr:SH3 domain-containing protein [Tepidiformaceae bacterium]
MSSTRAANLGRLALLLTVLAAAVVLGNAERKPAAAEGSSNIADVALRYLDTHGGQCWTFMQTVVAEATGRRVGPDYRQGFFEAGAVEVSADEAARGDIIQIASDADTSPWASYSGLHTAIVLENLGGGVFNAVDSNQNWDEMVRLRPNYSPYAAAARYGLQVHIYRIPSASGSAVPASDGNQAWTAGAQGVVAAGSDCLNLRTGPSLYASRQSCLPSGTAVTAISDGTAGDGFVWVQVDTAAGQGWVAALYIAPVASAPADIPPPAAPAAAAAEATLATATVDGSPGCLRVRGSAGLGAGILDCLAAGSQVTVLSESTVATDGYQWLNVRTGGGVEGWVASEFLIR